MSGHMSCMRFELSTPSVCTVKLSLLAGACLEIYGVMLKFFFSHYTDGIQDSLLGLILTF